MNAHRTRLIALVVGAALAATLVASCSSGGSDSQEVDTKSSKSTTTTEAAAAAGDSTTTAASGPTPKVPVTPKDADGCRTPEQAQAETKAPEVKVPDDVTKTDPQRLDATDDIPGCGELVTPTSTVKVQYVLKSAASGKEVDSSWTTGQPFDLTLGQNSVIQGWELGIPGMRAGGQRTLVLGDQYAYGPAGQPPSIAAADTLVFVVDVLEVS